MYEHTRTRYSVFIDTMYYTLYTMILVDILVDIMYTMILCTRRYFRKPGHQDNFLGTSQRVNRSDNRQKISQDLELRDVIKLKNIYIDLKKKL